MLLMFTALTLLCCDKPLMLPSELVATEFLSFIVDFSSGKLKREGIMKLH